MIEGEPWLTFEFGEMEEIGGWDWMPLIVFVYFFPNHFVVVVVVIVVVHTTTTPSPRPRRFLDQRNHQQWKIMHFHHSRNEARSQVLHVFAKISGECHGGNGGLIGGIEDGIAEFIDAGTLEEVGG